MQGLGLTFILGVRPWSRVVHKSEANTHYISITYIDLTCIIIIDLYNYGLYNYITYYLMAEKAIWLDVHEFADTFSCATGE